MAVAHNDPIYPISVAARILDIHPRTLRLYEVEGLIHPRRQGQKRFFSNDDIDWIQCLRDLIHQEGISIPGIKRLLFLAPCWEIKRCTRGQQEQCSAYMSRTAPCWEIASTACSKKLNQCTFCEVRKSNRKPGPATSPKH